MFYVCRYRPMDRWIIEMDGVRGYVWENQGCRSTFGFNTDPASSRCRSQQVALQLNFLVIKPLPPEKLFPSYFTRWSVLFQDTEKDFTSGNEEDWTVSLALNSLHHSVHCRTNGRLHETDAVEVKLQHWMERNGSSCVLKSRLSFRWTSPLLLY